MNTSLGKAVPHTRDDHKSDNYVGVPHPRPFLNAVSTHNESSREAHALKVATGILACLVNQTDETRHDICLELLSTAVPYVKSEPFLDPKGLDNGRNIICTFSPNPTHRIVLGAHYDRVENSPGANDNAAAISELVGLATEIGLSGLDLPHLTIVLFDNEEVMGKSSEASGSYHFANFLKANHIKPEKIVVLDVSGAGDAVLISSTTNLSSQVKASIRRDIDSCYVPSIEMWTPNSDSLMFNLVGYECCLLCAIPTAALKTLAPSNVDEWNTTNQFPAEWMRLHSPDDNLESVSPDTMMMMIKVLRMIAELP